MEKRNRLLFLSFALILIIAIVISLFSYEKQEIPASFHLSNISGFDLTPGKLTFGAIAPGQNSSRTIEIKNLHNYRISVKLKATDEISNNIIASENSFTLNSQEAKNITFTALSSGLSEYKEYKGNIIILTKRKLFDNI